MFHKHVRLGSNPTIATMPKIKNVHVLGGGTIYHVSSHFALSAPAYGSTAKRLAEIAKFRFYECNVNLELTKMAGGQYLETNQDISNRIDELIEDPNTKVIFLNCALVDWKCSTTIKNQFIPPADNGKYARRFKTTETSPTLYLHPQDKIISKIRKNRKDIFLVGFKTTCGATKQEMYEAGLNLCKSSSVNLVLVNDVETRFNMIITPEEAAYCETEDREKALIELVDMAWHRSHLTFTQSTVIASDTVKWSDERIPDSIRKVVDHCIESNAYKPFKNSTVGHFAIKLSDTEFLTSIRKSNFNDLDKIGMVYVKTDGPDTVLAYGAKPSVGGQSQRIVFREHEGMDCIVHFHSPLKENPRDEIPVVSQREVECGSHQCGQNTSTNLKDFGFCKVVMLDQHGPNIVFNRDTDPSIIIDFITANFDLNEKTGGYNI
jgi:hypothetical protein